MRTLAVFLFLCLFSPAYAETYVLNVNANLACFKRAMGSDAMDVYVYSDNKGRVGQVLDQGINDVVIHNFRWEHSRAEERVVVKVKSRGLFEQERFSGQCVVSVRGDGFSMADAECMGTNGFGDTDCLRGMSLHLQKIDN